MPDENEIDVYQINRRAWAFKRLPLADRLRLCSVDSEGGCRTWIGWIDRDGYGWIGSQRRSVFVHRAAWELVHGDIPGGLTIDHRCRNRACINVEHLRLLTVLENAALQIRFRGPRPVKKTHCKRGHPFDEQNTYATPGRRACRACQRDKEARRRERMRGGREVA